MVLSELRIQIEEVEVSDGISLGAKKSHTGVCQSCY